MEKDIHNNENDNEVEDQVPKPSIFRTSQPQRRITFRGVKPQSPLILPPDKSKSKVPRILDKGKDTQTIRRKDIILPSSVPGTMPGSDTVALTRSSFPLKSKGKPSKDKKKPNTSQMIPIESEMTLVWTADDSKNQYHAEIVSPANGQVLELKKDSTIIGRASSCDISLMDNFISRRHLEFSKTPLGFLLKNIGKNEVYLEKKSISKEGKIVIEEKILESGESAFLAQEATIILGEQILYYFNIPNSDKKKMHLETSTRGRKYNFYKEITRQKDEMLEASKIQKILTPPYSYFPDINIGVWFKYFAIGDLSGDFFLHQKTNEGLYLCLGDVSGHGPAAALLASNISGMFSILSAQGGSSEEIIRKMNKSLTASKGEKHNLYSIANALKITEEKLEFCIAGNHVPPMFYSSKTKNLLPLNTSCTPMGMVRLSKFTSYHEILNFVEGDMLILLTDGATEAEISNDQQVGYSGVYQQIKKQIDDKIPIDKFLDVFLAWLDETSEIQDDLSMVLISRVPKVAN